jgi:hypothetical protein
MIDSLIKNFPQSVKFNFFKENKIFLNFKTHTIN